MLDAESSTGRFLVGGRFPWSLWGRHALRYPVLAGRKAGQPSADPDTSHCFHYIPDVANGLAALGAAEEDVLGRPWILPCAPPETSRALVARLSAALGKEIRLRGTPRPVLKLVGLFVPILRELAEMLHQWEVPFVVDDSRFRERFGTEATDLDVGAAATVAWAKSTFGHGPARRA